MVKRVNRETKDSGIEWIGEIPQTWKVTKLKNYVTICNGKDNMVKIGKIPVYGSGGIFGYTDKYIYDGESVLMGRKGTIDKPRYVTGKFWTVDTSFYTISKPNTVMRYFYHLVSVIDYSKYKSGSTVPSMTQTTLNEIKLPFPSKSEQVKIADFLDRVTVTLDSIIENTKIIIEDYKLLKQSIITEAVTKGLHKNMDMKDTGNKWIGQIPKNWSYTSLKNVLITPITDGPHETPILYDEGFPFVSAEAIKKEKVDFSKIRGFISTEDHIKFSKKVKPVRNDIFMVKSGATTGNIGIVETDDEFSIWSPLALIRANADIMLFKYLYYYLQSKNFRTQVEQFWNYGTQQNIGMKVLGSLQVIVPNIQLQKKIADYLDDATTQISHLIEKKEGLLVELEKYKKSLIYEYVTGKKEVE